MAKPIMYRGSTPTHTFNTNVDLTDAVIWVSYKQGCTVVEKTGDDVQVIGTTAKTKLTQEDTLSFKEGEVRMQLRYRLPDGSADASNIMIINVAGVIKDGVI